MHSLSELRDFFVSKEIEVKEFNGWSLKVGKDTWTMLDNRFYKNNEPQSIKQKDLFDNYKRNKQNDNNSTQTRKWRGIGSGRLLRNRDDD